jgi:ABC-type Fe3+-hydroxamate transport system substrate-binding protein
VPTNPQRVIAADGITLGNMIALGVKPVGTVVNLNSLPSYLADQMQGVVNVTNAENSIDLEKALSLNADLIISIGGSSDDPFNEEDCTRYREAVATFCYEYWYSLEEEIKMNLTEVARALGKEDKAREVIANYDRRVEDLKQKVRAKGLTDKPVSVVRLANGGNYSIRFGTSESIIFRDLGIAQPPGQQDPEQFRLVLSLENLNVLNQSHTLFVYVDDNAKGQEGALLGSPVWKSLTPVQAGRVYMVSSGIWNSVDMLGAMRIMDDIERTFLA